jgi:Ca-activated chloride channel family protein
VQANESEVVAKDVILVLDTSGSMDGEKMDQAKEAASFILRHLNAKDRFGMVAFSTSTRAFRSELAPSSDWEDGVEFVNRLEALGSTDINRALLEALDLADQERPTTLIFLTDGLATEGVQDTQAILNNVGAAAPKNVRIFCFGVGDDVDTDLLDQLSLDHSGAVAYVRFGQKIDEVVSGFYGKVSTPVLSDLKIDFQGVTVDLLYPENIPDLFAGSQIVLVGRYRQGGPGAISLSGSVNGEEQSFVYPDIHFREAGGVEFIPRLWATRAVGYYLTQIRLKGEKQEWIDSIVSLSTRYGIITPYTSFLIQEEDIFTPSGRTQAADVIGDFMAEEAAAPSYGKVAVEKAAFQSRLSSASSPAELPAEIYAGDEEEPIRAGEVVKYMGSKAFLLRNETWIDTAFNGEETEKVAFLSTEYFDLMQAVPALGNYFSLGEKVIVVYEGHAYEVTSI